MSKKKSELVLYKSKDGQIRMDVQLEQETLWLSLNQIALLFGRDKSVISRHFRNIFKDKELDKKSVVAKNATTAADGKIYQVDYYNLDAIISVGYRVNSKRGTEFRPFFKVPATEEKAIHPDQHQSFFNTKKTEIYLF